MSTFECPSRPRIRLLEADADLAEAIPQEDRAAARHFLVCDAIEVPRGPWSPDLACHDGGRGFALVVVRGLLLREVLLADRRAAQVYGPGDVLRPSTYGDSSLSDVVEWTVMDGAVIAVLDDSFRTAGRRWPGLTAAIDDRLFAQLDRVALHLALAQLPRIESRLLALLWHLADRFGQVTSEGVVVPLAFTHDALGRLVGARRPTVSLGLSALLASGYVRRRSDGRWVLDPASRTELAGGPPLAPRAAGEGVHLRLVSGDAA